MKHFKAAIKFSLIIMLLIAVTMPASADNNIDLDYRGTDIRDVIRSLALIAGENVVVDDSVEGEITVQLSDVSFETALEHLLKSKDLESHRREDVIIVATPERLDELYREVGRELITLNHLATGEAREILVEALPGVNVHELPGQNRLLLTGFPDRLQEAKALMDDIDEPQDREQRIIDIYEQRPEKLAEEVRQFFPMLTVRPRTDTGDIIIQGSSREVKEAAEFILELDVPARDIEEMYRASYIGAEELVRQVEGLFPPEKLQVSRDNEIISLRGRPEAVNEAREILAELDEESEIEERLSYRSDYIALQELKGIVEDLHPELDVASSEGGRDIILQGAETAVEKASSLISELDRPRRQVMIEVLIEEISHTELKQRGVDPGILEDITTIGIDYEEGEIDVTAPDLFQLLDEEGVSRTIARPRLMSLDGEEATLTIGDRVPYEVKEVVDGEIQTVDYEYADVGINLDFVPTITRDDTITLDIKPEVSSITEMGDELTPPQVRTRELENIIYLEDEQTFAVGGLIQDELEETVREFPFLADLPLLGELFRYRTEEEDRNEIIIFITPHIVDPAEQTAAEEEAESRSERETDAVEETVQEFEQPEEIEEEDEGYEFSSRELKQLLFRSRLSRREDWPDEYEFVFVSERRISRSGISELYNITEDRIEEKLKDDGDYKYKLTLPSDMVYELKPGETVEDLARESGVPAGNILSASRLEYERAEPGSILVLNYPEEEDMLEEIPADIEGQQLLEEREDEAEGEKAERKEDLNQEPADPGYDHVRPQLDFQDGSRNIAESDITDSDRPEDEAADSSADDEETREYFVQVGAFSEEKNARIKVERLNEMGYEASISSQNPFRVQVAGGETKEEAEKKAEELKEIVEEVYLP